MKRKDFNLQPKKCPGLKLEIYMTTFEIVILGNLIIQKKIVKFYFELTDLKITFFEFN